MAKQINKKHSKKLADKTNDNKKRVLEALQQSLGNVTLACKNAGISRTAFYDYYNQDEQFKKRVREINEERLDFAESQLLKNIHKGDTTSIIFFLKKQARDRGYGDDEHKEQKQQVLIIRDASN